MKINKNNYILTRLQSVAALLLSFCILCLGHGLLNTVIGLRATVESYSDITMGLMTSAYFAGFLVGTKICADMITKVGHIRAFSVFATVASALALVMAMYVNPYVWVLTRFFYGAALAALFMIMESWLNLITKNEERGQILSFYMITNYIGMAGSQALIYVAEPADFVLFAAASIFLSIALVPLAASQSPQPTLMNPEAFSLKELIKTSPLAAVGCFATGAMLGGFWGMGAYYLSNVGMNNGQVALFIAFLYVGSFTLQYPLGYISDKIGRRKTIVALCALSALVSAALFIVPYEDNFTTMMMYLGMSFFFGGLNNTLYSLFLALANDFLKPGQVVKASAGFLSVHALGAIIGPLMATVMMIKLGDAGLMLFCALVALCVLVFALRQVFYGRKILKNMRQDFVAIPRTGLNTGALDPRQDTE